MIKGCDISRYQDLNSTPQRVDFTKLRKHFDWISIRVTFGDVPDEDFEYNWKAAADAGFLRMAYIFYDYRKRAGDQAAKAMDSIGSDKPELYAAWDMEKLYLWNAATQKSELVPMPHADSYLSSSLAALNTLKAEYGRVHSYINPDMIKNYLGYTRSQQLAAISDLWIAHWGVSTPSFAPWMDYRFHQIGSLAVDPVEYGIESKELDIDEWNGTLDELYAYSAKYVPQPPPPVVPPVNDYEQRIAALEGRLDGLESWAGGIAYNRD